MAWYDTFSNVYDLSIERVYRPYRPRIAAALRLRPGALALDLACGTGQNFEHVLAASAPGGRLLGVDFSEGMLARAGERGLEGVTLIQADAAALEPAALEAAIGGPARIEGVLCTLGLSVIPNWSAAFQRTWELLAPGGRYAIFDVHAERWVPQSSFVQLVAQADLKREVWAPLEAVAEDFALERLEGSPHIHGGSLLLASGTKPAA